MQFKIAETISEIRVIGVPEQYTEFLSLRSHTFVAIILLLYSIKAFFDKISFNIMGI